VVSRELVYIPSSLEGARVLSPTTPTVLVGLRGAEVPHRRHPPEKDGWLVGQDVVVTVSARRGGPEP